MTEHCIICRTVKQDESTADVNTKDITTIDISTVISKVNADNFKGRYNCNTFESNLLNALKEYKFTLETVISSRGYSISSIAISRHSDLGTLPRAADVDITSQ